MSRIYGSTWNSWVQFKHLAVIMVMRSYSFCRCMRVDVFLVWKYIGAVSFWCFYSFGIVWPDNFSNASKIVSISFENHRNLPTFMPVPQLIPSYSWWIHDQILRLGMPRINRHRTWFHVQPSHHDSVEANEALAEKKTHGLQITWTYVLKTMAWRQK